MRHETIFDPADGPVKGAKGQAGTIAILGAPATASEQYTEFATRPFVHSVAQIARDATGIDQLLEAVRSANWHRPDLAVLYLPPPHTFSNRLYQVHPRRNDRFIAPSAILRDAYPSVDFTPIHFAGHLMSTLWHAHPKRYRWVCTQILEGWRARMKQLIKLIDAPVIVLSHRSPTVQAPWNPLDFAEEMHYLSNLTEVCSTIELDQRMEPGSCEVALDEDARLGNLIESILARKT